MDLTTKARGLLKVAFFRTNKSTSELIDDDKSRDFHKAQFHKYKKAEDIAFAKYKKVDNESTRTPYAHNNALATYHHAEYMKHKGANVLSEYHHDLAKTI